MISIKVSDISKELDDFLIRHNMSLITTHRLYQVWQGAKEDQKDIVGIFQQLYSHPGGVVPLGASENSQRFSPNLVTPQAI